MRDRDSEKFPLTTLLATAALVGFVSVAALLGHERANQARDATAAAHHMASLAEIQALMKKAQEAEH